MISIIVAAAKNGVIGKSGQMAWSLPAELAYFRQKTTGHPIIMGRVTHTDSIGRILPNRTNIIITRDKNFKAGGSIVVGSLDEALRAAKKSPGSEEIFIIGGESIYMEVLPLADRIYLTKVDAEINGDRYFVFDPSGWRQTFSEKHPVNSDNEYPFEFTILERKKA